MEKLTAEMKAEIQAKRLQAEINERIRNAKIQKPIPAEPKRSVKVLPEAKEDPYRRANPVSRYYDTIEIEAVIDDYTN